MLIWIGHHFKLRPGRLMVVYVLGYIIGRFWIEGLRIDNANTGGGLRLNQWVALGVIAGRAGVPDRRLGSPSPRPRVDRAEDDEYVPADE